MTRTPPTFVTDYKVSSWSTTTTPKTVSATASTNDVMIAVADVEGDYPLNSAPTGGTGLSWTQDQQRGATGNYCPTALYSCVVGSGQSWTFSLGNTGSSREWGFDLFRFASSDGVGASAQSNNTTGGPSVSLTTTADNSAVVVIVSDWSAANGASRVWRTVNSITPTAGNGYERVYDRETGFYATYVAYYPDVGAAGSKTFGLSTPSSGMNYVIMAIEVKGSGSSGVTGTGSVAMKKASLSVSATEKISGTGSVAMKKSSLSVSATEKISGTGSVAMKKPSLAATGAGSSSVEGTGSVSLKKPSLSASGTETETGTGSVAMKKPSLAATGGGSSLVEGTGSVALKKPSLSASATEKISGTGSVAIKKPSLAATGGGNSLVQGTGSVALKKPSLDGDGDSTSGGTTVYSIWPDTDPGLSVVVDPTAYTLAVDFYATEDCQFTGIRFYSGSGAGQLPTWAGLFEIGNGTPLTANHPDPGWDGSAGDGWVKSSFDGSITLTADTHYRAFVFAPSDGGNWYTVTNHYFDTGDGASGTTSGILVAPGVSGVADGKQGSFHTDTVDYPGDSFQSSNYWVDVEVTVSGGGVTGSGSVALKKPSLAGSGTEEVAGTGSVAMHKMALAATGGGNSLVQGTGSVSLKKPSLDGSSTETISGTGSVSLKKPSLDGSGTETISGIGSISLHKPAISGTGAGIVSGIGSVTLKKSSLSASGTETISGTGSVSCHKLGVSGSATEKITGTGNVNTHKMSLSGSGGALQPSGTGSVSMHKPGLSASGSERVTGTGSVSLHKPALHSTGASGRKASPLFVFTPV